MFHPNLPFIFLLLTLRNIKKFGLNSSFAQISCVFTEREYLHIRWASFFYFFGIKYSIEKQNKGFLAKNIACCSNMCFGRRRLPDYFGHLEDGFKDSPQVGETLGSGFCRAIYAFLSYSAGIDLQKAFAVCSEVMNSALSNQTCTTFHYLMPIYLICVLCLDKKEQFSDAILTFLEPNWRKTHQTLDFEKIERIVLDHFEKQQLGHLKSQYFILRAKYHYTLQELVLARYYIIEASKSLDQISIQYYKLAFHTHRCLINSAIIISNLEDISEKSTNSSEFSQENEEHQTVELMEEIKESFGIVKHERSVCHKDSYVYGFYSFIKAEKRFFLFFFPIFFPVLFFLKREQNRRAKNLRILKSSSNLEKKTANELNFFYVLECYQSGLNNFSENSSHEFCAIIYERMASYYNSFFNDFNHNPGESKEEFQNANFASTFLQLSFSHFSKYFFPKKIIQMLEKYPSMFKSSVLKSKFEVPTTIYSNLSDFQFPTESGAQISEGKKSEKNDKFQKIVEKKISASHLNHMDLFALDAATTMILNETEIDKFLKKMMESIVELGGAEKGYFLLNENGRYVPCVRYCKSGQVADVFKLPDFESLQFESNDENGSFLFFFFWMLCD